MPPTTIRFGGYQPPSSVHNRGATVLGDALAEIAPGLIEFELDGDIIASGRKAADLLDLVADGTFTMCYFSSSYLTRWAPDVAAFDLPFVVDRREDAYAALDGELGQGIARAFAADSPYRVLGYFDNGFRHLSNRRGPIRSPADCRGLRIRTLFSELHQKVFRALGFEPVPLDVKELLEGVRDGTIDAQDNPLTNIYNFGVHQHHRFVTLTGHFFGVAVVLCNRGHYESWSEPVRDAVDQGVARAVAAQRGFAAAEDDAMLAALDADGVDVVSLDAGQRAAFVEAVAPVLDSERGAFSAGAIERLAGGRATR